LLAPSLANALLIARAIGETPELSNAAHTRHRDSIRFDVDVKAMGRSMIRQMLALVRYRLELTSPVSDPWRSPFDSAHAAHCHWKGRGSRRRGSLFAGD